MRCPALGGCHAPALGAARVVERCWTCADRANAAAPPPTNAAGLLLQRALAICAVACAPVALLWLGSNGLLVAMGQEPDIAVHASRYLKFCIPCLFLSITTECLRK